MPADFAQRSRTSAIRMLCRGGAHPRVEMRGRSMLPLLREPMVLQLETLTRRPAIGEIVVFEDGERLVAHRVVGYGRSKTVVTSGDATGSTVETVRPGQIVGRVRAVFANAESDATRVDTVAFHIWGRLIAVRAASELAIRRAKATAARAPVAFNPLRRPRAFVALFSALEAAFRNDADALRSELRSVEPERLAVIARRHRCAPFLSAAIESLGISGDVPKPLVESLRREQWSALLRTRKVRAQVDGLVRQLLAYGEKPILLKGAARLYSGMDGAEYHASDDIDLLFPLERLSGVVARLEDDGYREAERADRSYYDRQHHAAPLYPPGPGVPLELHRTLARRDALHMQTDAEALAPFVEECDGSAGRVCVLNAVGTALHLAIHARESSPLRDIVLLAQVVRAMSPDERRTLRAVIDSDELVRIRLHAMTYAASRLGGFLWETPPRARRYFDWRLRRNDLPWILLRRSEAVDVLVASGWRGFGAALTKLMPQSGGPVRSRTRQWIAFLPRTAARTVLALGAGPYAMLMPQR